MSEEIVCSSVPSKAAEAFREYADKEFDGDMNMALRELVVREKLRTEVRSVEASLLERIQALEKRVVQIEGKDDQRQERNTIG